MTPLKTDTLSVDDILAENKRRKDVIYAPFNPVTGLNSIGERVLLDIADFPIRRQWIPAPMMEVPLVKRLYELQSLNEFIRVELGVEPDTETRTIVVDSFTRIRCRYDFPFWAAVFVYIKNKDVNGDPEVLFRLTYPQRKFVSALESFRLNNKPIRLVLLKARQW